LQTPAAGGVRYGGVMRGLNRAVRDILPIPAIL